MNFGSSTRGSPLSQCFHYRKKCCLLKYLSRENPEQCGVYPDTRCTLLVRKCGIMNYLRTDSYHFDVNDILYGVAVSLKYKKIISLFS